MARSAGDIGTETGIPDGLDGGSVWPAVVGHATIYATVGMAERSGRVAVDGGFLAAALWILYCWKEGEGYSAPAQRQ